MHRLLLGSVKLFGVAAAGVALAVGWKLGSYLVDVALDEETRDRFFERVGEACGEHQEQPLWKRRFSRVSED
jgi:hypothetical protein